jgi:hypothetical protein
MNEILNQPIQTQPSDPQKQVVKVNPLKKMYQTIDSKMEKLIPNKLMRKVLIITIVAFIAIFIFLFILGIILTATRTKAPEGFILNKPVIVQNSPEPEIPDTPTGAVLGELREIINDLKFPDSLLTKPVIETKITVEKKR